MRKFLAVLSLVLVIGVIGACSARVNDSSQADQRQDSFVYAIAGDPISMNPLSTSDRWGLTVTNMIFSPLARMDAEGNLEMELAESVDQSEDGKTVTVTLRPDAKFSDGQPVTAEDVVFTYETMLDPANGQADKFKVGAKPIRIEQLDGRTVRFIAPQPSGALVNNIVFENYILPKHVYQDVEDFSGNKIEGVDPVGSGPYQLEAYRQGQDFRFAANPHYYKGKAKIDKVIFQIIKNAQTTKAALLSGEIDATLLEPLDVLSIDSDAIQLYPYSEGRVGYIGVNTNTVDDENFRKAIFYALDREEINQAAYFDETYYTSAHSILPPSNPYYYDDIDKYHTDLDKAKAYLDQSGLKHPRVRLAYNGESQLEQTIVTMVQEQLAKVGIETELKPMDSAALSAANHDPKSTSYDLFIGGYIMGLDPSAYAPFYTTGGAKNYFKFSTPEGDRLFQAGEVEVDPDRRKAIYNQAQSEVMSHAIFYPYVDNKKIMAVDKRISGVEAANLVPIYQFGDASQLEIQTTKEGSHD
ncbi:ABC transporter substrate-binding protein [Aerococcus sp. UMB7834]|uniref:ABC transporter substrate-binding protein n=1 Tax=Aerococcus sp. UMB7834 TaxID=3046342 RepID=UPI00254D3B59|nr:ABC transporter substrate-binding protein [Aerococcus sp. UMB7834]MDK6804750.1 ABC transporter substrate-binding protein [Aerococcus sp. UMB7834]